MYVNVRVHACTRFEVRKLLNSAKPLNLFQRSDSGNLTRFQTHGRSHSTEPSMLPAHQDYFRYAHTDTHTHTYTHTRPNTNTYEYTHTHTHTHTHVHTHTHTHIHTCTHAHVRANTLTLTHIHALKCIHTHTHTHTHMQTHTHLQTHTHTRLILLYSGAVKKHRKLHSCIYLTIYSTPLRNSFIVFEYERGSMW